MDHLLVLRQPGVGLRVGCMDRGHRGGVSLLVVLEARPSLGVALRMHSHISLAGEQEE